MECYWNTIIISCGIFFCFQFNHSECSPSIACLQTNLWICQIGPKLAQACRHHSINGITFGSLQWSVRLLLWLLLEPETLTYVNS